MLVFRGLSAAALAACFAATGCSNSAAPVAPAALEPPAAQVVRPAWVVSRQGPAVASPFVFGPDLVEAATQTRKTLPLTPASPSCTPLTIDFPGHGTVSLTAAVVGPISNATVNAAGCDIGIYLDSSANGASLVRDTIVDANQFGVLAIGTQNLGISGFNISRIGNHDPNGTYDPNGVQTGVGLYFEGVRAVVTSTSIGQYQKNGTAFNGGSSVAVSNTTAIGAGSVNYIAQNGIQYYYSTVVSANRNFAKSNVYNNPNDPVYDHQATGFLVLCTNLKYVGEVSAFERINVASQNDYNYYVSNQGC